MTRLAGKHSPRVTVVIATYNRARMLRCALQSALLQEFDDFEVIVVGDGCTDESSAIVSTYGGERVRWLNRQTNCGSQWGPNNDGISHARGEYVALLGHDDLWLPWHLETLVPLLDAGADLAHPIVALLAPDGVRGVSTGPPPGESYRTRVVPPSGWTVRRSVVDGVGGFRDHRTIGCGTDEDLLRRIARAGYRIEEAPRLSVLKFPSHWWRSYHPDAAVPQERWIAAIQGDAGTVEREILTQAVAALAAATPHAAPLRALGLTLRASARWLRHMMAGDDTMMAPLMRVWFRRQHAATRRRRGL